MNNLPPQSLAELREALFAIEQGNSPLSIGQTSLTMLKRMLASPSSTAVSTMSSIAGSNNVHPSTLTRLAYSLGYKKFSALHKLFRDHVEGSDHFYTNKVTRLIADEGDVSKPDALFETILEQETQNVGSLNLSISRAACQQVVDTLINARKVRFHGRRQFYCLAAFYSYSLGLIRENIDILQDDIHGISHSLNYMNERDLLVVMGCAPYTKATVDACQIAQSQGIQIIAITDTPHSPLAQFAMQHLIIPTESEFYSNSMAAAFALAEATLAMTAQQMGTIALETLEKREKMIEQFGISVRQSDRLSLKAVKPN